MTSTVSAEAFFSTPDISCYFDQATVARVWLSLSNQEQPKNASFAEQVIRTLAQASIREKNQSTEIYYLLVLLKTGNEKLVEEYIARSILQVPIETTNDLETTAITTDLFLKVESLFDAVTDDTEFGSKEALELNQAVREYWKATPKIIAALQVEFDTGEIDEQLFVKKRNEIYINLFSALSTAAQFNAGPEPKSTPTKNQIESLNTIDRIIDIIDKTEQGSLSESEGRELDKLINQFWFIEVDATINKEGVNTSEVIETIGDILVVLAQEGLIK